MQLCSKNDRRRARSSWSGCARHAIPPPPKGGRPPGVFSVDDYQRDSRYGDDNEVLALPARPPRTPRVAWSCGAYSGHEHATQEEARACTLRYEARLSTRLRAKVAEWRERKRESTGGILGLVTWQLAAEIEALLGEG